MTNYDGLYNKDFYKDKFNKNYFSDKNLHFRIIENGTVLPHKPLRVNGNWTWGFGGIVNSKGEFIKSSFVASGAGAAYTPDEEIIYNPATAVYIGMFFSVWGHSITDNIKRLWFLKSEVFKKYFKDCPVISILWGGGDYSQQLCKITGNFGSRFIKVDFYHQACKISNNNFA